MWLKKPSQKLSGQSKNKVDICNHIDFKKSLSTRRDLKRNKGRIKWDKSVQFISWQVYNMRIEVAGGP